MTDPVNRPPHYTSHLSGVECIEIAEHLGFCLGNAIKYVWRHSLKGGAEDLRKAEWYLERCDNFMVTERTGDLMAKVYEVDEGLLQDVFRIFLREDHRDRKPYLLACVREAIREATRCADTERPPADDTADREARAEIPVGEGAS